MDFDGHFRRAASGRRARAHHGKRHGFSSEPGRQISAALSEGEDWYGPLIAIARCSGDGFAHGAGCRNHCSNVRCVQGVAGLIVGRLAYLYQRFLLASNQAPRVTPPCELTDGVIRKAWQIGSTPKVSRC